MPFVIIGLVSLLAGGRTLALRRRRLEPTAAPASSALLRPGLLAVLAGLAITCGLLLVIVGVGVLFVR